MIVHLVQAARIQQEELNDLRLENVNRVHRNLPKIISALRKISPIEKQYLPFSFSVNAKKMTMP